MLPRIISVDDHVVEPPDLWLNRIPARYHDRCPRVERDRGTAKMVGGVYSFVKGGDEGDFYDWWLYDDLVYPFPLLSASVGFDVDERTLRPTTFDEIAPGCWKQPERLAAMDENHVEAALCFPNVLPRFCGQTFLERDDKDLALLCVRAYNDWIIDEWCAGEGRGRLIPMTIVPLWSPELAAAEIRRCASKGSHAVSFSEAPYQLGLPSFHHPSHHWDPLFAACEETETVVNMHIGSSSKMPTTSPDAPMGVSSTLTFQNAMGSMVDLLLSGTFARFPRLVVAYSEGQVGWMPYILDRIDKVWEERRASAGVADAVPEPPSTYFPGRIYGCIFDDPVGLEMRHRVGMEHITFEVDYPHSDSTYPHSAETAQKICDEAGLDEHERYLLVRGNAIRAYGLERFGITE